MDFNVNCIFSLSSKIMLSKHKIRFIHHRIKKKKKKYYFEFFLLLRHFFFLCFEGIFTIFYLNKASLT